MPRSALAPIEESHVKIVMLAAVAAISCAASAQPAAAPAAPVANAAPAALDGNSPIEALVASPVAKPILLKHFPNLDKHDAYEMFKSISLRDLAPMSDGGITEEKIVAFDAELKTAK